MILDNDYIFLLINNVKRLRQIKAKENQIVLFFQLFKRIIDLFFFSSHYEIAWKALKGVRKMACKITLSTILQLQ